MCGVDLNLHWIICYYVLNLEILLERKFTVLKEYEKWGYIDSYWCILCILQRWATMKHVTHHLGQDWSNAMNHISFKGNIWVSIDAIIHTRWAGSSKTFNNSGMELHKCLKFGTRVVLFKPLKIFQNNFNWIFYSLVIITERFPSHKAHLLLRPLPKLVGSPNWHVNCLPHYRNY